MREIKFRAWDAGEKCWVGGFCIHESGLFSNYWSPKNRKPMWWTESETDGRIFIQQFTGLKDRNGKEIYEGDLLQEEGYRPFLACFFDGKFVEDYGLEIMGDGSIMRNGKCEVIGNIHESPELLK